MYRFFRIGGASATGSLAALRIVGIFSRENKFDTNKINNPEVDQNDTESLHDKAMQRVKDIFKIDEYGYLSREANATWQSSFTGFVVGVCYGGFIKSRIAYNDFFQHNQAEVYTTHHEARSKLQHEIMMAFMKGGFSWGWRIAAFTGVYVFTSTCISVYRGKSSVLEYSIGGMLAGAIYKLSHGIRGIIVGSILGLILGSITGTLSVIIMKLGDFTMEDVVQTQHDMIVFRSQQAREAREKALLSQEENNNSELIEHMKLRDEKARKEMGLPEAS